LPRGKLSTIDGETRVLTWFGALHWALALLFLLCLCNFVDELSLKRVGSFQALAFSFVVTLAVFSLKNKK
jgi:hypothetical protein